MLQYHQAACDLLGLASAVDLTERAAITERERQLGVKFPASLVEWYSLRGAQAVLAGATGDRVLGATELGEPSDGWGGGRDQLIQQGLLVLRVEQQRTWAWPGHTNYRFGRGDQRVVVWDGDGQAEWSLLAGSAEGLASLGRTLWNCGELASSLYAPPDEAASEAVLKSLRAGGR